MRLPCKFQHMVGTLTPKFVCISESVHVSFITNEPKGRQNSLHWGPPFYVTPLHESLQILL